MRKLKKYKAPFYDEKDVVQDGRELHLCNFSGSVPGVPGSFAIISQQFLKKLTAWVSECGSSRGICAINGMMKTGKSTILVNVLPQIILKKFPDAEICLLDFNTFLPRGSEPREMEEKLLKAVANWAKAIGIDVGSVDDLDLNLLNDILDDSGRKIFFLIDEVQRFFEVDQRMLPIHDVLKGFFRVNRQNSNLHFAVTGSAMVLAWHNFLKMTPNGFTFVGECWNLNLPSQNDPHELDYARSEFLSSAAKDDKEVLAELLAELPSVPLMAYTANIWKDSQMDEQPKSSVQERVNCKLLSEFVTEMTGLLQDPSWSSPDRLKYIHNLAMGTVTEDPSNFFGFCYQSFFEKYILKLNSGKFKFVGNPWTTCILRCVAPNGTVVLKTNEPILQLFQNGEILQKLVRVGELVRSTVRGWKTLRPEDRRTRVQVERICRKHGREHGWQPAEEDYHFQRLLNWSNDGVRKSIEEHGFKMKWCTYLEMLRNANAHFTSKNGDEYKQLLTQCLPNRAVALLTALKNFTLPR